MRPLSGKTRPAVQAEQPWKRPQMELGIYSFGDVQNDPTTGKRGSTALERSGTCAMTSPGLSFMHFRANDHAEKLANGLKAALEKVAIR